MPKPPLKREYERLESDLVETLIAGHKQWRPDLSYPESHSDMCGAVRGLLKMYEVKRRPLALTDKDLVEPSPTCVICEKPAGINMMGVHVCSNDHARAFAHQMLAANPERSQR